MVSPEVTTDWCLVHCEISAVEVTGLDRLDTHFSEMTFSLSFGIGLLSIFWWAVCFDLQYTNKHRLKLVALALEKGFITNRKAHK